MADVPSKPTQAEEPIDPQEFQRILAGTQLRQISMLGCQANLLNRKPFENPDKLAINLEPSVSHQALDVQSGAVFGVVQQYVLTIAENDQVALLINIGIQLDYQFPEIPAEGFWEVFQNTTVLLQTIPYAREFFQSITARMGLPIFTLPMIHLPGGAATSEEPQIGVE